MSNPSQGFLGVKRRKWLIWTPIFFLVTFMLAANIASYLAIPSSAVVVSGRVVKVVPSGLDTGTYNVTLALTSFNTVPLNGLHRSYTFHVAPPVNSTASYGVFAYTGFFPFAGSALSGYNFFTAEGSSPTASTPALAYSTDTRIVPVYASAAIFSLVLALGLISDLRSRDFRMWRALRQKNKRDEKAKEQIELDKLLKENEMASK